MTAGRWAGGEGCSFVVACVRTGAPLAKSNLEFYRLPALLRHQLRTPAVRIRGPWYGILGERGASQSKPMREKKKALGKDRAKIRTAESAEGHRGPIEDIKHFRAWWESFLEPLQPQSPRRPSRVTTSNFFQPKISLFSATTSDDYSSPRTDANLDASRPPRRRQPRRDPCCRAHTH